MKKEATLATKFTMTFLIIFLIVQTLGFTLFILSIRDNLLDSMNIKMENIGNLLAGLSARTIMEKNAAALNTYMEEVMKDEDIVSMDMYGREENLIGHKSKVLPKESSVINPFYVKPFLKSETPVILKSEKIGHIVITLSSRRINDEISKYLIFGTLYQGLLLIVIILLVSEFFSRSVRKPISDFTAAVSKAGTGDLTVTMQHGKNLELKMLTAGFNSLITRLKNIIRRLYSTAYGITGTSKQLNMLIDRVMTGTRKQIDATEGVISAMEKAENSQKMILNNTHELAVFSQENSSSFEQIGATTKEISERTKELSRYSSDVYSTVADILAEIRQVAKSAEDLAAATEVTTASVEEMGSNLAEIKESTRVSEHLASDVKEVLTGIRMKALADAVTSMRNVEIAVDKNLELVRSLQIKSHDVEKVLSVLDDVTKQTNLLSVNAAILAAQAGEYGSGFAVVADEIKTFATRTTASAKEITKIIKSIQKEIIETLYVTESSKQIVKKSKDLVMHTDSAIAASLEKAQSSSDMTKNIQKATEEQVKGIFQLNEAMDMLMAVVTGVTEIVLKQESKALNLLGIAGKFKDISEVIKNSMKEQNAGTHIIARNLDLASEMIQNIDNATSEHEKCSEEILALAMKMKDICGETLSITREMTHSFGALYIEAETFKKDIEGFKIE